MVIILYFPTICSQRVFTIKPNFKTTEDVSAEAERSLRKSGSVKLGGKEHSCAAGTETDTKQAACLTRFLHTVKPELAAVGDWDQVSKRATDFFSWSTKL